MQNEVALKNDSLVKGFAYTPNLGLALMKEVAQEMIDTGLCPQNLNQPGQLIAVGEMGRSLGIDWITAVNNIDNIQGRPTLSYRLIGALLNRARYEISLVRDYEPQYDAAGNCIEFITEMQITNLNLMDLVNVELNKIKDLPEDVRKMALLMLEQYPSLLKRNFRFTWTQASQAGLMTKANYLTRPIEMFRARCLTGMVRLYCPQILMGFYETSELHDVVPETSGGDVSFTECEEVK